MAKGHSCARHRLIALSAIFDIRFFWTFSLFWLKYVLHQPRGPLCSRFCKVIFYISSHVPWQCLDKK